MLKNEPQRAQRTAEKLFRFPVAPKPQTFGALGGLGGSSFFFDLEFQQATRNLSHIRRFPSLNGVAC
jgi:hypothetical protein